VNDTNLFVTVTIDEISVKVDMKVEHFLVWFKVNRYSSQILSILLIIYHYVSCVYNSV